MELQKTNLEKFLMETSGVGGVSYVPYAYFHFLPLVSDVGAG